MRNRALNEHTYQLRARQVNRILVADSPQEMVAAGLEQQA